jgi:uncharacterized protein
MLIQWVPLLVVVELVNYSSLSPCNGVCHLRGELCIGCFRTTSQIIRWINMSDSERMVVMKSLDTKAKCPKCGKWNKCALEEGKAISSCWCFGVKFIDNTGDLSDVSCYCKTCLTK